LGPLDPSMSARSSAHRFAVRGAPVLPALASVLALLAGACNDTATSQGSDLPVGSIQSHPQSPLKFVVASSRGGSASNLRLLGAQWGRLVDVYALDSVSGLPVQVFDDYVASPSLVSDGIDLTVERLPGSGTEIVTILHSFGTPEFQQVFATIDDELQLFIDKSLHPSELPPFTAVARNGAILLTFDDLLDAATITPETVKVRFGYPPNTEFHARILPDMNHGDLIGGAFHTTRVVIDLTVSPLEAAQSSLPVNAVGLAEALTTSQPSVAIRLPTRTVAGSQFELLTNPSGSPLSFNGNGSTDPTSESLDVVRAFRAGGRTSITGDQFNGFLPDNTPPRVMSSQSIQVQSVIALANGYLVDLQYGSVACAVTPLAGDMIAMQSGVFLRVLANGSPPAGGFVDNVQVAVIEPVGGTLTVGNGEYRQVWTKSPDQDSRPECWVVVQPPPATGIATGIRTTSTFTVQFTEPMDPASVSSFDTLQVLYGLSTPTPLQAIVAGETAPSADVTRFTVQPSLPLRHATGGTEIYRVNLPVGPQGATDLAGNPLQVALSDASGNVPEFTVLSSDTAIESRSLSLRFFALDEDELINPAGNEFRGQAIPDFANGRLRPRSVSRISGSCDQTAPLIQFDLANGGGLFARPGPFNAHGARYMTLWRYADLGFTLFEDATHNLDVEGLNWAPSTSFLQIDTIPNFQIGLSHSRFLPDELLVMGAQVHPNSGVSDVFADNLLDPNADPLKVVHQRAKGYFIQPIDLFTSSSGTKMAPWPLNQDVPVSQYQLYTWRDTANLALGQPNLGGGTGEGVPLGNEKLIDTTLVPWYPLAEVPTVGLPLLMDFRGYANAAVHATNLVGGYHPLHNPLLPPQEIPPFFTAITYGGIDPNNPTIPVIVDPDQVLTAVGGVPVSTVGLLPRNQHVMFGQGDFVIKVNRVHTRWFECAPGVAGQPFAFASPVIEPKISDLPPGTQVRLHFRGATGITTGGAAPKPWERAENLDFYGDSSPVATDTFTVVYTNQDPTWKEDMTQINGSQFFQCRITMISNIESGATPNLSSLGFSFFR
jgi:hypothetical protein